MFNRVVSFNGVSSIDAGVRYLNDRVASLLREQKGFRGVIASADRASGQLGVLTLWETEAERDASESALLSSREESLRVVGGEMSVQNYEEGLAETAGPPAVGSVLLLLRISIDPARFAGALDSFKREVLPRMKASPGFRMVRLMLDPRTGEGRAGSIWADKASMDAWEKGSEALRQQAAQQGVTFTGRSEREIVFADLRLCSCGRPGAGPAARDRLVSSGLTAARAAP